METPHRHLDDGEFAVWFSARRSGLVATPRQYFGIPRLWQIAGCVRCTWQVEEAFFLIDECASVEEVLARIGNPPLDDYGFYWRTFRQRWVSLRHI